MVTTATYSVLAQTAGFIQQEPLPSYALIVRGNFEASDDAGSHTSRGSPSGWAEILETLDDLDRSQVIEWVRLILDQ